MRIKIKKQQIFILLLAAISQTLGAWFLEIREVEVLPKTIKVYLKIGNKEDLVNYVGHLPDAKIYLDERDEQTGKVYKGKEVIPFQENKELVFEYPRFKRCGYDIVRSSFCARFKYFRHDSDPKPYEGETQSFWKKNSEVEPFQFPEFREPIGPYDLINNPFNSALQWGDLYFDEDRLLFGYKVGSLMLDQVLNSIEDITSSSVWQTDRVDFVFGHMDNNKNFSGGLNVDKQTLDIDLIITGEKFEKKVLSDGYFSLGTFKCEGQINIAPICTDYFMSFVVDDYTVSKAEATGGLLKNAKWLALIPFGVTGKAAAALLGVSSLIVVPDIVEGTLKEKVEDKLADLNTDEFIGDYNDKLKNIEALFTERVNVFNKLTNSNLIVLSHLKIEETGLWYLYDIDANYIDEFKSIIEAAKSKDLIQVANSTKDLINAHAMQGFNLDKINSNQKNLIVSLSGAGVWNDAYPTGEGPIDTYIDGDNLISSETFGDGTYKLPYTHVNEKTVSIIGYPWLNAEGALDFVEGDGDYNFINDLSWGPSPRTYAQYIKAALDKMGSGSKLVLLGKSLGGCKMQKIVNELYDLNVDVDLLILVDPSCYYADQSSVVKPVYSNVKKFYNFRQISIPGHNDGQNGFQLSYQSPTNGHDVIVSDIGNDIGELMCEGTGHNNVDECEALQNKIQELIEDELKVRIDAVINMLLLD